MSIIKTIILCTMIMNCVKASNHINTGLISAIMDYISSNFPRNEITLITHSSKILSATSVLLIHRIARQYSSLVLETSYVANTTTTPQLSNTKNFISKRAERFAAKIIFIEADDKMNIVQELIEFINFLVNFISKSPRPKCLIFLINQKINGQLKELFRYAWKYKFIDITIIEIVEQHTNNYILPLSVNCTKSILHQYNPFNDNYKRQSFTGIDLFTDRLKNLHGLILHVGMYDYFPQVMLKKNYNKSQIWKELYGLDVMVSRILSEKLNYTVNVKLIIADDSDDLAEFNNQSYVHYVPALREHYIDYSLNLDYIMGTKELSSYGIEFGSFLQAESFHIIIQQYGTYNIKFSKLLIYSVIIISVFVVLITMYLQWVHKGTRLWTIFNIIQILIGTSITLVPKNVSERIIFILFSFTSIALSANMFHELVRIYMEEQQFLDLSTIQGLVDSNIIPSVSQHTITFYAKMDFPAFHKLLNKSKIINNEFANVGYDFCLLEMLNSSDSVSGCEVPSTLGSAMEKSFSDGTNGWIIALVKEPFATGWSSMMFESTSPYINTFNRIFRYLYDAGITHFLFESAIRNFSFVHKEYFGDKNEHFHDSHDDTEDGEEEEEDVNISILKGNKLIFLVISAYLSSAAIFMCEILSKYFKKIHVKFYIE